MRRRAGLAGACMVALAALWASAVPAQGAGATPAAVPVAPPASAAAAPAAAPKVLRYAFRVAETSFDPAAIVDLYSRIVTGHIFEGLYGYDPLARPALIRPLTAAGLPLVEDGFRRYTFHVRPGIFFADDPAFGGRPRELVAADYVFALERVADPAVRSPNWSEIEQQGIVGLAEQRRRAVDGHRPFDYDVPVAGL
jgi:peptide/nickel transport system substrate-binding protein